MAPTHVWHDLLADAPDDPDRAIIKAAGRGKSIAFELMIEPERIRSGHTFSEEAFERMLGKVGLFIGARVCRAWENSQKAPTRLSIIVTADAE